MTHVLYNKYFELFRSPIKIPNGVSIFVCSVPSRIVTGLLEEIQEQLISTIFHLVILQEQATLGTYYQIESLF